MTLAVAISLDCLNCKNNCEDHLFSLQYLSAVHIVNNYGSFLYFICHSITFTGTHELTTDLTPHTGVCVAS